MPHDDQFQSTMRIEIPPELLQPLQSGKQEVAPPKRAGATTVIRIPAKQSASAIGGPDFHELLQSIYDAAVITDIHGAPLSANVRAEHFFRTDRAEICRGNVVDLISGADESLLQTICNTLESDRFVLIQACCLRKDGSFFPAEISVNRLNLSAKAYLSFFIRDITLRKEAEERLKTGYNALQNSGNGIAVADLQANLGYCNPAMIGLLGLESPEEAMTFNFRQFLPDEALANEIVKTTLLGQKYSGDIEMRRKDGGAFFAQASVAPNTNPDGELTGIVISLLDITEQKLAQRQLELYARQLHDKNAEMEADLNMAREIQYAFLPSDYPVFAKAGAGGATRLLDFGHVYHPSGLVGGDFFDIIKISDSQAGIFIADVMGHGARAALVVATIRGLIEQLAPMAEDPGSFMTRLNDSYTGIFKATRELMFATALYLVFDTATGEIKYTNAGHPFPLQLRASEGLVQPLPFSEGAKGSALGLFRDSKYAFDQLSLRDGDRLLFYTDGLTEAKNENQEEFDFEGMVQSLQKNIAKPLKEMLPELVADARRFSGAHEFDDDVCILGVGFRAG